MSLTDDLALVTACRDNVDRNRRLLDGDRLWFTICDAALSLIEDTLNDHAPQPASTEWYVPNWTTDTSKTWPSKPYTDALAALHTIATALGVEVTA